MQSIAMVALRGYNDFGQADFTFQFQLEHLNDRPFVNQQTNIVLNILLLIASFTLLVSYPLSTTKIMAQAAKDNGKETFDLLAMKFEPREYIGTSKVPLKYRLLKPMNYQPGKTYPLLLFLHGAGERGIDNLVTLKHGAKEFANDRRREQYPCYVVMPQCPNEQKWSDVDWSKESSEQPENASQCMQSSKELVDEMVESAGVDKNRIYITGLSMGGYGTWDAIARYEDYFAAAAPICGGGDPKMIRKFSKLPIWCFHGESDPVVKVKRSREMISALKDVGSNAQYTEYPGVQHDSWTATYSNPDFYRWLFAQRKSEN